VFPDGQIEAVSAVQKVTEDGGFEVHDGPAYAARSLSSTMLINV